MCFHTPIIQMKRLYLTTNMSKVFHEALRKEVFRLFTKEFNESFMLTAYYLTK
jgi:hypothetical protein